MLSDVTDVWQYNLATLTLTLSPKNRQIKKNQKGTENENESENE